MATFAITPSYHTKIIDIKLTTSKSLERYENIKSEFILAPQNIEGVELHESATKYHYGDGVEKDITEAFNLYNKSANKGNAESQISLYYILVSGDGVEKDGKTALFWLIKAAEQGSSEARTLLAECYYQGDGVTRDLDLAKDLYTSAAIQGNTDAQYQLGRMYHYGIGVETNLKNAVKWYELSQNKYKYADIQYELGSCYELGDEINGLDINLEKALQCYIFSAKHKNPYALSSLGTFYEFGRGVDRDVEKAIHYYLRSIECSADETTWSLLGSIFYKNENVKDYDKAIYYLTPAAEKGLPYSQTELAYCYYYGREDKLEAFDWFSTAARNGDAMAAQALNFLDFN